MTTPPFKRALIANRGEIAVRLIRGCHELGMEAVAVYSDADVGALHVAMADLAVRIGPPAPADSYLRIDRIIEAALATGSGAIHPGYGFLAERAAFARAAEAAGIVFVGPSSDAIDALGDKLHARRLARSIGVEPVPGTLDPAPVDRPEEVARIVAEAEAIGFPLLVKAAAGGGGRGCGTSPTAAIYRPPSPPRRPRRSRRSVTDPSTWSGRSVQRDTSKSSSLAMRPAVSSRSASVTARFSDVTRSWSRRRPRRV